MTATALSATPPPPIHPALETAFVALNRDAHLRWCVLRGWHELHRPSEDVDLLVDGADVTRAVSLLRREGYVERPSWGRGSHRFLITYVAEHNAWIKLDVVSELAFGPGGELRTSAETAVLDRTDRRDPVRLPHPDDAFWALLLHSWLDRDRMKPSHLDILRELSEHATAEAPLARWVAGRLPNGVSTVDLVTHARNGDGSVLQQIGNAIDRGGRDPATIWRSTHSGVLRRMTKLRRATLERGFTVALLGMDGAGKSTVAKRLETNLPWPVRSVYLGLYGGGTGGTPPRGLVGRLLRLWSGYARGVVHRLRGRVVVYDRFSWDALVGGTPVSGAARRLRRWLLAHAIPPPDLVVVLDAPAEVLFRRKPEHDLETVRRRREAYLSLARSSPRTVVVRTDRPLDTVVAEVTDQLWNRVVARGGR